MKKKFSTAWKASSQPRKQRKYKANAPLHLRKKVLSVSLSKDLKKKYEKRNLPLRKDDTVKVLRGKFKTKQGKVKSIKLKLEKIYIEGIQTKKNEGSKVDVPLRASNLQIIELNTNDKRRMKRMEIKKTPKENKLPQRSVPREISKEISTKGKEETKKDSKLIKKEEKKNAS